MPRPIRSLVRVAAVAAALFVAGCAVEMPQPPPAPGHPPATTPRPAPPSTPPAPTYHSYAARLEAAARAALMNTPVQVSRDGDDVKLIVPADAAFGIHTANLRPGFLPVLDTIAQLCRDYAKTAIAVKGFTDSTGSFEHNQHLSEQRAQSIGAYLGHVVAAARISATGYGPRYPIADNGTDAGRRQNRRVEIDMVAVTMP